MPCSAKDVAALVERELAAIVDAEVRGALRSRITTPALHLRSWDYGTPGEHYPCWTIAADPELNSAIVYSEHGFGPSHPWGIVALSDLWYGMDSGWFGRLEDAFVDSFLATDLPIWNVVLERRGEAAPILASSLPMDGAFAIRDALAARNPEGRYHVVYRSQAVYGVP